VLLMHSFFDVTGDAIRLFRNAYGESALGSCYGDRNWGWTKSNPLGADLLKILSLVYEDCEDIIDLSFISFFLCCLRIFPFAFLDPKYSKISDFEKASKKGVVQNN